MSPQWLNPADHFTLLMDHEIRGSGLAGNHCALVLELAGVADAAEIARRCADLGGRLPLSVARLQRRGRRYAWLAGADGGLPFSIEPSRSAANQATACRQVLDIVNRAVSVEGTAPFELTLLQGADTALLVLRWFHPATDAKGAELLLHHLFADAPIKQPPQPSPVGHLLAQWGWWRKLLLARRAVRNIRRLDRQASVLPPIQPAIADSAPQGELAQTLLRYDAEQTGTILANAREQAGMTGITLYLIGCMMRAMESAGASADGDAYCVPYAANLRRRKALTPIFGNQVSFLFAQVGRELLGSRPRLFAHLREQHKQALRDRLDHAMLPLMQAGSWLPLQKYSRIVRQSPQGRERSSFWFSFTGEMEPQPAHIAGCAVQGMYQLSPVTTPPGLGLLVSQFDGRLTLSYSYPDAVLERDWVERVATAMTVELLDGR